MEVCGTQRIRAHLLWQLNVLLIICPLLLLAEDGKGEEVGNAMLSYR